MDTRKGALIATSFYSLYVPILHYWNSFISIIIYFTCFLIATCTCFADTVVSKKVKEFHSVLRCFILQAMVLNESLLPSLF